MDEYIKREYAIDAVLDVYYDTPDIDLSGEKFEAAILKIQAADVAPVRHGHWGKVYKSKVTVLDGYVSSCCDMWNERRTNYCPNCGAKMDLEG